MFLMPGSRAKSLNPSHAVQYLRSQNLSAAQQLQARTNIAAPQEGTITSWTPVITCATPGNLAIVYSTQVGKYYKLGKQVTATFDLQTSSFTWTTASGAVSITGLPFASNSTAGINFSGALSWGGFTHTGYTSLSTYLAAGVSSLQLFASGQPSIGGGADVISSFPTGGTVEFIGTIVYFTD